MLKTKMWKQKCLKSKLITKLILSMQPSNVQININNRLNYNIVTI